MKYLKKITLSLLTFVFAFLIVGKSLTVEARTETVPYYWEYDGSNYYYLKQGYITDIVDPFDYSNINYTFVLESHNGSSLEVIDDQGNLLTLSSRVVFTFNYLTGWDDEDLIQLKYYKMDGSLGELTNFYEFNDPNFLDYINNIEIKYYAEVVIENISSIDELPLTIATENYTVLGTVSFVVDGVNLLVKINYDNKIYYLNMTFSVVSDMNIFNSEEAYYMNVDDTPQIFINHSDRYYLRDILEGNSDETPTFVPHSIWDLKTNEIKTVNTYKTNVYIKQNPSGVLIAYVYIDEFIMDKILTAEVSWVSRMIKPWWARLDGKYTEWNYRREVLDSDKYLRYRNLTSGWRHYIPVINIITTLGTGLRRYSMPQIDYVNFNNIQFEYNVNQLEIETKFREKNKDFIQLKDNPRYKLWAFALQEAPNMKTLFGNLTTEPYNNAENPDDPMNFQIIELTYETDGKLYTALGSDMDLYISIHPDLQPDGDKTSLIKTIFIVILALLYVFILIKANAFKSGKKFLTTTLLFGIVALVMMFVFNNYVIDIFKT